MVHHKSVVIGIVSESTEVNVLQPHTFLLVVISNVRSLLNAKQYLVVLHTRKHL